MSYRQCLERAVQRELARPSKVEEALRDLDARVQAKVSSGVDPAKAEDDVLMDHIQFMQGQIKAKVRQRTELARAQVRHLKQIEGSDKPGDYLNDLIDEMDHAGQSARSLLHASLNEFLDRAGYKGFGVRRNTAHLPNVVRELYGDATNDATAKQMAAAIKETESLGVKMLRNKGVDVAMDDNWRLPQLPDSVKMMRAGTDAKSASEVWSDDIINRLDWKHMEETWNDKAPIPDDEASRRAILARVFQTITTDGANKATPGAQQDTSLATRLASRRFLRYKSAEDYLYMQEKYGFGDTFQQVATYVDTLANDIGLINVFGPNPQATRNFINTAVERRGADLQAEVTANPGKAKGRQPHEDAQRAAAPSSRFNQAFDIQTGLAAATEPGRMALTVAGTQNLLISSLLGGTPMVSVPSDLMTATKAAHHFNMPATRVMKRLAGLYTSAGDRKKALRSGLLAESLVGRGAAMERFTGEVLAPGWTRTVADVTLRANGLQQTTQLAEHAWGVELMGWFADHANYSLRDKNFPRLFREEFERAGITPDDWDKFRATEKYDPDNWNMLRPKDVFERTDLTDAEKQDLFFKFQNVISASTRVAVPQATLKSRAAVTGAVDPSTLRGGILKSVSMLKSFPVAIYFTHIAHDLGRARMGDRVRFLAGFTASMTMVGGIANQLLNVASGRDFQTMDPTTKEGLAFWGAAALKGGGMGILGDFLFSDLNRYGGGMADTLAGPMWQFATDATNLTFGNLKQAVMGEDTKAAAELLRFVNNYAPGSRIWYLRTLKDRLLVDTLAEMADPQAAKKARQRERKMFKETGQRMFWRFGESLPHRAPAFGS